MSLTVDDLRQECRGLCLEVLYNNSDEIGEGFSPLFAVQLHIDE